MKSRVNWLVGLATELVAVMAMADCGHQAAITPPQIHYGEEVCAFCQMTIDDPRFAAALIYRTSTRRQKVVIFDDIGCMLAWQREHAGDHAVAAFVHDYKTRYWITAGGAWYVRSTAIQTPMGWGIAAGESQTDAEGPAPRGSVKPMGFSELWSAAPPGQGTLK